VHDLAVLRHPEWFNRWTRTYSRVAVPRVVSAAQRVIAVSEFTRRELVDLLGVPEAKIRVVPNGIEEVFTPEGPRRDGDYALAVGTLEPRKNLPRLVEAFARLSAEVRQDRLLVLVGALGWDTSETVDTLRRHSALVRELGHVDDDELRALYRGAELFAYPSLYEGFGLPVLEAMASGTPVLTSRTSSLPEVAGDAAVYVDPRDIDSIASGLGEALTDPDRLATLTAKGIERARLFSWDRTAAETLGLLEQLYARRGARS
jgi:alpha-1,3-rhamnosyl/mannosyltransferase